MRINTRLSPRVQLQFRVPERRSLGTRLTDLAAASQVGGSGGMPSQEIIAKSIEMMLTVAV